MSERPGDAPQLSVVIPVRNGATTLIDQLTALATALPPRGLVEVVVADDGSTDSTTHVARSVAVLDVVVVQAAGRGTNAARNSGIRAASGDRILLCDADDQVDEEWLRAFERGFDAGHELMGGPIDYRHLNPAEVVAWRGAPRASLTRPLGFLPAGHGASLALTRSVFDRLGGFDEAFVAGGTDAEFVWRAQLAGIELHLVPDAVAHYRLRHDVRSHWRQWVTYGAAEAHLYRVFASHGAQRRPLRALLSETWWLATRLPRARSRARWGAWVRRAAAQCGRLTGGIRYRVLWW